MKTKQWIYNFNSIEPNQQLEIVKALVEELKDNERYLAAADEYNNEMSKAIRLFFNKLIKNTNTKQDLKALQTTLSCFQSLSPENQSKVIESIVSSIQHYYGIQEQEQQERICQSEGHIMGEWKYYSWKTYEDTIIDHQHVHGLECHHKEWTRTCKRCGFKEKSNIEPEEERTKREESEKQDRIKKLEKELREIRGNNK